MNKPIEEAIYRIRGKSVMLDQDLAILYQLPTKVLNQSVRRNLERFPVDFMFQLTSVEIQNLRSQLVTSSLNRPVGASKMGYGGRRYQPLVFTEQGVAMLSSVLRSSKAIQINSAIIRAFVKLRHVLNVRKDLLVMRPISDF